MFSKYRKGILIETTAHKYTTFNIFDVKKFKMLNILNKSEAYALYGAKYFLFDNRYLQFKFMVAGKATD